MDKYAPSLLDLGLKGMIGKGARNKEVVDAIVRNKGVYLVGNRRCGGAYRQEHQERGDSFAMKI